MITMQRKPYQHPLNIQISTRTKSRRIFHSKREISILISLQKIVLQLPHQSLRRALSCRTKFLQSTEWRYQNFDRNWYWDIFSDTKFSETETETFFRDQIFPKPRLFSEIKVFRNRDFFSETKFSETETETFFRDQIFSKPKPRLFFRNQIFRYRNRNLQKIGKSFETEKFRNRNVNLW